MSEYDLLDTASGNVVVVALDHDLGMGAIDGFEDLLARGLVMGRSVWQTADPAAVVSALRRTVHDSDAPGVAWPP
ncbi:hypothetical protein [Haloarcula sp. H-GB5]